MKLMRSNFKIRLCTLDDDEAMHFLIKDALDHADIGDYEMFEHYDPFFESLDKHVHIAIIDHYLGGQMTGLDIMKRLLDINPNCYVIIISGTYDLDLAIKYQEEGSKIFIKKDSGNFTGKLVFHVNKSYRNIFHWIEFIENTIEELRDLKTPC